MREKPFSAVTLPISWTGQRAEDIHGTLQNNQKLAACWNSLCRHQEIRAQTRPDQTRPEHQYQDQVAVGYGVWTTQKVPRCKQNPTHPAVFTEFLLRVV